MKKIIFAAVLLFAMMTSLRAESPLLGIGGFTVNSSRALQMSVLFEGRILAITESTDRFPTVNTALLKSELARFNCLDEKCMLRLAADSGIKLFIRGSFDDRGNEIILNVSAYAMDVPYNGREF